MQTEICMCYLMFVHFLSQCKVCLFGVQDGTARVHAGAGASSAPPGGANWTKPLEETSEEVSFSFTPADPNLTETELYRMHVYKIENDSEFVALYTTQKGTVFKTMMAQGFLYSNEQELHVYGIVGSTAVDIRDAWGNKYYKIEGENLRDFTRMGIPLFPF